MTRAIRCWPSIYHGVQRLGFRSRMQLEEPVEPQKQLGLRCVFVSSAPHHRDMLGHHFAQLAAERSGLARSEEHTSALQALMRNSYAVFCLKKKTTKTKHKHT